MKLFHIGDLIGMSTGTLVSPKLMEGLHAFAEYLNDGPVWTHQLVSLQPPAAAHLQTLFPWLAGLTPPVGNIPALETWLAGQVREHGEWHEVPPMPPGMYQQQNPLTELAARLGGAS